MKRYLADTHALLFFLSAPEKLGPKAERVFETLGRSSEALAPDVAAEFAVGTKR